MDFPKQPQVPNPQGAPQYRASEQDSLENHPSVVRAPQDTPQDWDMEPWFQQQAEFYAERDGTSLGEAQRAIKNGAEDSSTHVRPSREDVLGEAAWRKWQGSEGE